MNEWTTPTPSLTLDPAPAPAQPAEAPKPVEQLDPAAPQLSPEEERQVADFARQINLRDSSQVLLYGSGAQKKIADFSQTALENVRAKDLGEVGQMLTGVVDQLRHFDLEKEDKGFFGFFKKNRMASLMTQYAKVEENIEKIANQLQDHQVVLLKDMAMLDKMYEINKVYFKELSMYILAGRRKLEETRAGELAQLTEKARTSNLPEDAQAVNDLVNLCDRFEKKLHDLELTRTVSIQMAPQIRLVQNNDAVMSEKIQSTLVNTIPLWKSQMVLALGVNHSQQAAAAQHEVSEMTNQLLRRNAETLKMATIETARESERGIVDIETLKATNESLISTLDEVQKIQEEGRQRRREAEAELGRIEADLKRKLLELRG